MDTNLKTYTLPDRLKLSVGRLLDKKDKLSPEEYKKRMSEMMIKDEEWTKLRWDYKEKGKEGRNSVHDLIDEYFKIKNESL